MILTSNKKISRVGIVIGLITFLVAGCSNSDKDRAFWSPYEDLNWEQVGHYDSEFHTQPGLGDEEYDPHQTVDRYHEEGYKILSLAGHSYDIPDEIDSIYPWTKLSEIYETIKDLENPTEDDKTYEEIANEPFEDRDPVELGMISVEGSEVSAPHHTISLFSSQTEGLDTEAETYQAIEEKGGIMYFAHPGRYIEERGLTEYWYVDKYKRFDGLIGQSVYNREDSHPGDRAFFDRVVHILGAERPIWLYGEDDMHDEIELGWNRDVMLLESFEPGSMHPDIQDGSAPAVKEALKNGYSYLWKPDEQYNKRSFNIIDVVVSDSEVSLTVEEEDKVEEVRWRTHHPDLDTTETVHTGYSITEADVPGNSRFVRAEIEGDEGTIFTQPFYLKEE